MLPGHTRGARYGFSWTHARSALARPHARSALARYRAERAGTYVRGAHRGKSRHMMTVCCSQLWPRGGFEAGLTS